MAGERLPKITIRANWSPDSQLRGQQTAQVRFYLGGTWYSYQRGGGAGQFIVPDVLDNDGSGNAYGPSYLKRGVENLLALVRATIQQHALPYTISAVRDLGGYTPVGTGGSFTGQPVVEFDIEGQWYDNFYDLNFQPVNPPNPSGWLIAQNLGAIQPVNATAAVTDAGIFGSATGAITITATGGTTGVYTYAWSDGATGATRTNLVAGTYPCTITDASGASTQVVATVHADPELVVDVATTPNSITLTVRGGIAPYAYAWADGATTADRQGLPGGRYRCTVTDAHGASKDVDVTLATGDRYWFSGNPIPLSLQAAAPVAGLSFVLEVWVERDYLSGTFVQVGPALEQPADASGGTTFEVQELLEPFVSAPVPALTGGVALATGLFCRFFLKHRERTAAGDGAVTTVATSYLVRGGLGYRAAAAGTWFSSYQAAQQPFLTWEPTTKKVLPDQPEYLYFMAPDELPSGFQMELRLYWSDGTNVLLVPFRYPTARRYEVFCLPVGPLPLTLAVREADSGKTALRYEVRVRDVATDVVLSETRTFVPDRRPAPARRYFLYANSLGGWNTLVCRGRASQELTSKTQAADNGRPAGYDPLRGDSTISRRTNTPLLKCYAGARPAAQLLADQDFWLSERVLLLDKDHNRLLAGQVKDAKLVSYDENETRRVLQFDYELPVERFYTPAPLG